MKLNFLDKAFIRTPLFSLGKYKDIPDNYTELQQFVKNLWNDIQFRDAVYLSSPELYMEWEKFSVSTNLTDKNTKKLSISLLKYYIRAVSKSTPFGLFSTYSLQQINTENEDIEDQYIRKSTLDFSIVYKLLRLINQLPSVRNLLIFKPNPSLYKVGNDYRYIEIKLSQKREHVLISLEADEVLELIFSFCDHSKSIQEISDYIYENVEDVNQEEIYAYVSGLIDEQILISNLDVCLNKPEPMHQLKSFLTENSELLEKDQKIKHIHNILGHIEKELKDIDNNIFNQNTGNYHKIYSYLDEILESGYDKKYVVSSNLKRKSSSVNSITEDQKKIYKAIEIFSFFSRKDEDDPFYQSNIEDFKKAFYERYEDKAIPLVIALDNEIGIGYKQGNKDFSSFSDLIDDIDWNYPEGSAIRISYDKKTQEFWSKKLLKAHKNGDFIIDLTTSDFPEIHQNVLTEMPHTFSVMYSKCGEKIIIGNIGNTSATNLLGRFSNSDDDVHHFVSHIANIESSVDDKLHCELLHVQDDRDGNLLIRNVDREYEVPFLTTGSADSKQVSIQDIYIKIWNNKIILIDKKHNKELKIYNSSAHNYHYNSLPIYQFLNDIRHQDMISHLSLNFGHANQASFRFFPRITYGENLILSPASWKIKRNDFIDLNIQSLLQYLKDHKIPRYFYFSGGENEFLMDSNNEILMSVLLEEMKKSSQIYLRECIYNMDEHEFANEIILSVKNNVAKINHSYHTVVDKNTPEKFIPGQDWLYYRIYTGVKVADDILMNKIRPLADSFKEQKLISEWFFIRYNDPDFHLRLRLKINSTYDIGKIMSLLNTCFKDDIESGIIWKIELGTYERELERYGYTLINKVEQLFYHDSELVTDILQYNSGENNIPLWMLISSTIHQYLSIFEFDDGEKLNILERLSAQFNEEFYVDKNVKKQIDRKFRDNQSFLSSVIENPDVDLQKIIEENFKKIDIVFSELKIKKEELINSIIHMHINRYIRANARAHELLIYNILHKFYKERVGKMKFNNV
ncbi:lantibiotic dehydratase [Chryseobacterium paridis]|uniref:Lantibiotic dehydratase n=1 Tax=Chryseobacterium paridis TaxID=2800328 RepID=A0ABS1FYN9_9FLAO|nr:lantibiotic dehydratase [Chryseobacterium paridis]MBK1897537.1 lantibiotic dehydratase [Chryseobacterium paridis]